MVFAGDIWESRGSSEDDSSWLCGLETVALASFIDSPLYKPHNVSSSHFSTEISSILRILLSPFAVQKVQKLNFRGLSFGSTVL